MGYTRERNFEIDTAQKRHAIKHVTKGQLSLAVEDIMSSEVGLQATTTGLANMIYKKEIAYLSSEQCSISLAFSRNLSTLASFSWMKLWDDLKRAVPSLSIFLQTVMPSKAEEHNIPAWCTIIGMIAKHKNNKLNMLQQILSILLYAGHTTMQVWMYYCNM